MLIRPPLARLAVLGRNRLPGRALHTNLGKHSAPTQPRGEVAEYFLEPQTFSSATGTGLFGIPGVTSADGMNTFTRKSLEKAQQMAQAIESGQTPERDLVLQLDVLSDVICKVVDMAAFVRITHPDARMLRASQRAHELMFDFMNYLNTSPALYSKVAHVLGADEVRAKLSREEVRVGEILKHDFEKSGIQFAESTRNDFVQASNTISVLGQQFLNEIGPGSDVVRFASERELDGLPSHILQQFTSFTGKVELPLDPQLVEICLRSVRSSTSREKIWRALRTATPEQVERLTEVLRQRGRLAQLSGYESFAAYELTDKMMKTPENVHTFLASLMAQVRPRALEETLRVAPAGMTMQPWDHSYYLAKHAAATRGSNAASRPAGEPVGLFQRYFRVGDVLQGISDLCETLYGIRLVPGTVTAGEVWDPEVRRLDVYEGDKKIGIIYCDLFSREGKSPNPAHFTIQCSRQVWPWERELLAEAAQAPTFATEVNAQTGEAAKHQLPVIVLVCDFVVQNGRSRLSFGEVQTLFHEMGHAVHSMLGRTQLHNVGGTRCATDFVELPSILMEKFASAPEVLALFARDERTGERLPLELFRKHQALESTTANWEVYHQIMLSLVDQALHGPASTLPDFDPAREVAKVNEAFGIFPNVHTQQWAQFGHLVSYGATYYSYLLDRCLANLVWDKFFKADPLSRESGEKFKETVLRWGGARSASECTRELVGNFDYRDVAQHITA